MGNLPYARNTTYGPNSPIKSIDLDDIQDEIGRLSGPLQIPGCAGVKSDAVFTVVDTPTTGAIDIVSAGTVVYPVAWRANALVRDVALYLNGDAAVDVTINVVKGLPSGNVVLGSRVLTNLAAAPALYAIDVTDNSPTESGWIFVTVYSNAGGTRVHYLSVK